MICKGFFLSSFYSPSDTTARYTPFVPPRNDLFASQKGKGRRETAKGFPDSSLCQGAKPLWKPRTQSALRVSVALNLICCARCCKGKACTKPAAVFRVLRPFFQKGSKSGDPIRDGIDLRAVFVKLEVEVGILSALDEGGISHGGDHLSGDDLRADGDVFGKIAGKVAVF